MQIYILFIPRQSKKFGRSPSLYNLEEKTPNRRLRPRLPQDILLTDSEDSSSEDQ